MNVKTVENKMFLGIAAEQKEKKGERNGGRELSSKRKKGVPLKPIRTGATNEDIVQEYSFLTEKVRLIIYICARLQ